MLWFDLMHDIAVYPHLASGSVVADEALLIIENYYRRVVIDSSPMGRLVGLVMIVGIVTNLIRLVKSEEPRWLRIACVLLFLAPTLWALTSIVPMAAQLSQTNLGSDLKSILAIKIFYAHVVCFLMISCFLLLQFYPLKKGRPLGNIPS